jgi:hypothetical protein
MRNKRRPEWRRKTRETSRRSAGYSTNAPPRPLPKSGPGGSSPVSASDVSQPPKYEGGTGTQSGPVEIEKLLDDLGISLDWLTPADVADQIDFAFATATDVLGLQEAQRLFPEIERIIRSRVPSASFKNSTTAGGQDSAIEPHEPRSHERQMAPTENVIIKPDGTLVKGGVAFRPLSVAASEAQIHRTTLLHWVKKETKVAGEPLQSYYFAPLDAYFVSQESIQRAANRFIRLPTREPAGPVTLGETDDQSGYLSLSEAQSILGVSKRTMYLWATQQGKAPTEKDVDVIQCTGSEHFYIRERDVYDLKKLIPKRGLHRGPRPQLHIQP